MKGIIKELKDLRTEDNVDKIDSIVSTLSIILEHGVENMKKEGKDVYPEARGILRVVVRELGGDGYDFC